MARRAVDISWRFETIPYIAAAKGTVSGRVWKRSIAARKMNRPLLSVFCHQSNSTLNVNRATNHPRIDKARCFMKNDGELGGVPFDSNSSGYFGVDR